MREDLISFIILEDIENEVSDLENIIFGTQRI